MTPIPFEPQRTIDGSRTCGAAALTMVYRSLGMDVEQSAVWRRVAEEIRPGVKATRTHRLALDAVQLGCATIVLQADQPAATLSQLLESDVRVILNHRLGDHSRLGHYSVALRFDGEEIEIHDPHHGPNRVLPWTEFVALWQPVMPRDGRRSTQPAVRPTGSAHVYYATRHENQVSQGPTQEPSEIVGRILVAIGADTSRSRSCRRCGHAVPEHWTCARCKHRIPIGPAGAVCCVMAGCRERTWIRLFCPQCDWAVTNLP